ncbi:MAG: class I SAM-dependent methyltransferase [Promethearchaeota archaeon]
MNEDFDFNVKKKRPEESYERVIDYFKGKTLYRYARSKSLMKIQEKLTIRALELLNLKKRDSIILDAGCGPGFTSIYLKEIGYNVIALDIISDFLYFYDVKDLNPIVADMCFPPFQSNSFDGIISISALQWIFKDINSELMRNNLINLMKSFERILRPNSKAIFQFFPKNKLIMDEIGKVITNNSDLKGRYVIDNPNSAKKRKIFLFLKKGNGRNFQY